MDIRENLAQIGEEMKQELEKASALPSLDALRVKVLGKKGSLTALLRGLGEGSVQRHDLERSAQRVLQMIRKNTVLSSK